MKRKNKNLAIFRISLTFVLFGVDPKFSIGRRQNLAKVETVCSFSSVQAWSNDYCIMDVDDCFDYE